MVGTTTSRSTTPPETGNRSSYCPSPASSTTSNGSASGGGGSRTKNVGVGANLSGKSNKVALAQVQAQQQQRSLANTPGPVTSPGVASSPYPSVEQQPPRRPSLSCASSLTAAVPHYRDPSPSASSGGSVPTTLVGSGSSSAPGGATTVNSDRLPGQQPTRTSTSAPDTPVSTTHSASSGSKPEANPNKMVSQNINGTLSVTSVPSNESELQLYRVLQRANLLNYFDVMIELGGDDVQQLCDAGEEEFLEIMALVGMASKPLHVRRLQKSLQEWMTQPHLFQIPMLAAAAAASGHLPNFLQPGTSTPAATPAPSMPIRPVPYQAAAGAAAPAASGLQIPGLPPGFSYPAAAADLMKNIQSKLSALSKTETNGALISNSQLTHLMATMSNGLHQQHLPLAISPSPHQVLLNGVSGVSTSSGSRSSHSPHQDHHDQLRRNQSEDSQSPSNRSTAESPPLDSRMSLSPVPFLQESEIEKIAEAATVVAASLPSMEPRINGKKKSCIEYETLIRIPEGDPARLDIVRRLAAIFGRQDCKRKVQKPLTLHELTVNEAAAQLCSRLPPLLTRRDELFTLARQVVKEAGLPYGAGIASIVSTSLKSRDERFSYNNNNNVQGYGKRIKIGSEETPQAYCHDTESDDSHQTNDSFSHQRSSRSTQEYRDYSSEKSRLLVSHSANNNCSALDMSSNGSVNSEEPNDLTISKNAAFGSCHITKNVHNSSNVVSRHGIKSEPVS